MDLETSCWSTGALANGTTTFYNPVQRRPKVDYFDSTSITPIVSHISSNGYYGYCPTTYVPSALVEVHSSSSNSPQTANDGDFGMSDLNVPMEMPNSEQSKHQGRSMYENRKRAVQCIADERFTEQDAKRQRCHLSVIDYVEDMQMGYDDAQDVTCDPSSNIAANQYPIEQFFVCIKQNMIPVDRVTLAYDLNDTPQIKPSTKIMHPDLDLAIQKTEDVDNSTAIKECNINDMENLYWHTHGSLLWQR